MTIDLYFCIVKKNFFRCKMAQIFTSYFTKSEFKRLYATLLPRLDICSNCGVVERCKACRDFLNTLKFFYYNANRDQWDYICNFLYDLVNIQEISQRFFQDVRIPSKIENIQFYISSTNYNNSIMFVENDFKMCYMSGNKKYRYFESMEKPIIHEFICQNRSKKLEK